MMFRSAWMSGDVSMAPPVNLNSQGELGPWR